MRWLLPLALLACGGGGGAPDAALPDAGEVMPPLHADPAVALGCAPGALAAGQTRAKPIACAAELLTGRLAAGRVGDLLLENARVRLVVRGPGEGFAMYGMSGGGIVDAARAGGEDLIKEIQPLLGTVNIGAFAEHVITEAGDDGPAELAVRGPITVLPFLAAALGGEPMSGVIEQRYRLRADDDAVEIVTRLWPAAGEPPAEAPLMDAIMAGGRMAPFLPGPGWAGPGGTSGVFLASAGTTSSYALVHPAGAVATTQLIQIGTIRLVVGPTVRAGGPPAVRWLVVGDGSVASVAGRAWALRGDPVGEVHGRSAPGVDVELAGADGGLYTVARADAAGAFRAALPPGAYTLRAVSPGRAPGAAVPVTVAAGQDVVADAPAGASGTLAVTVRDGGGRPIPARLLVTGAATGKRVEFVGATGDAAVALPPGSYDVSLSRGMEYDAFTAALVVIADGQTAPLAATLDRVVDTAGWIALDTHLHSEMSTDSTIPLDDRLRAVAAEGVELPVSTDHDFISDYGPVIEELGLSAFVGSMVGEELSSLVWGHVNAWPLAADPDRAAQGAPPWFDITPGQAFDRLRAGDPARVVQVNHPRAGGVFEAIDLDRATLTARRDPADLGLSPDADLDDLDFDAVEVANHLVRSSFDEDWADWLALVSAGHRACGTGSSDSHGAGSYAGNSRTYVWVGAGNDDPATVDLAAVNDAIRARRVVVGQGAFVVAGVVDPMTGAASLPGDVVTVPAAATTATLRLRVQAAPWMPLARVGVWERRAEVTAILLDPGDTRVVRYEGDVTVPLPAGDTVFVVRVDPAGPGEPVLGSPDASFTNPLFVDHDGDGVYTP